MMAMDLGIHEFGSLGAQLQMLLSALCGVNRSGQGKFTPHCIIPGRVLVFRTALHKIDSAREIVCNYINAVNVEKLEYSIQLVVYS